MRSVSVLFVLLFSVASFGQSTFADEAAFSESPQSLQKRFDGMRAGSNDVTVLLDHARFEFDKSGGNTFRERMVFKIWTKAGAENWAMIVRSWSPWQDERPVIRARVISEDGTVHELDQKTVADSPAQDNDGDLVTDRRMVKAPLPAVEPGAVVEQEVVAHETMLALPAGTVRSFYLGESVPVEQTRVQVTAPEETEVRFKTRLLPDLKISDTRHGGMRELVFDQGPMKALEATPRCCPITFRPSRTSSSRPPPIGMRLRRDIPPSSKGS